jgi:hypothetical protein
MPLDRVQQLWRDYALGIVPSVLFLASMVGGAIAGWFEYADWAQSHNVNPAVLGDNGYAWVLGEQTFQNWQSEWLAVAVLIVIAVRLIHRGSPESRDGRDQMELLIDDVERRVDALLEQRAAG